MEWQQLLINMLDGVLKTLEKALANLTGLDLIATVLAGLHGI